MRPIAAAHHWLLSDVSVFEFFGYVSAFVTHLLEPQVDSYMIQGLMGRTCMNTMAQYAQVATEIHSIQRGARV